MSSNETRYLPNPNAPARSGVDEGAERRKRQLPAYYKAAIVGCGLILLIVAVVGVAYLNVKTTTRTAEDIANQYQPALEHLLGAEADLHQSNVEIGNYFAFPMSMDRSTYVTRYRELLNRSEQRFRQFQQTVPELGDVNGFQKDYEGLVNTWGKMVDSMVKRDGVIEPNEFGEMSVTYSNARAALLKIIDQDLGQQMNLAATKLISESHAARQMLLTTLVVALLLGGAVTWAGVIAIRGQHTEILAEKAERERESRGREFEHRLHRAFELVQSEPTAFNVVRDAMTEALDAEHLGQLLIADSSIAHLERITTTPGGAFPGCGVTDAQECPAIRRNTQMVFATNRGFETCSYLRDRGQGSCSAMCMPISVMGRTSGVLHVVGPAEQLPDAEQQRALAAIATSTGNELGMLRAFATKHQQANTDTLTGLGNRRSLESRLPQIIARGEFSVAFIDIDRFKPLNDTHGHETGDRALRLFADVLRNAVRPDDVAARWGGEEFVVVLPGIGAEDAVPVVERIRENLHGALASGAVPRFTVSAGLSDSSRAPSFQMAIEQADEALLLAKRSGRDRIEVAMSGELGVATLLSASDAPAPRGRSSIQS